MRTLCLATLLGCLLLPATSDAAPATCDLAQISSARELHETLSRRAIDIVDRAGRASWLSDARLAELIEPTAAFSLGAGDVGRPLGAGPAAAHALALDMNAVTFRFADWDYMDMAADGCAEQRVDVEFLDAAGTGSSRVQFTFRQGRVVAADGWVQSIESGAVTPVARN